VQLAWQGKDFCQILNLTQTELKMTTQGQQDQQQKLLHAKLNMETSQIAWSELLRFFAGGLVIVVSSDLDLVDVAARFAIDDKSAVEQWLNENKLVKATDEQASAWLAADALLWAVVARPWVLVQENKPA
jgi:hypothetical protein